MPILSPPVPSLAQARKLNEKIEADKRGRPGQPGRAAAPPPTGGQPADGANWRSAGQPEVSLPGPPPIDLLSQIRPKGRG